MISLKAPALPGRLDILRMELESAECRGMQKISTVRYNSNVGHHGHPGITWRRAHPAGRSVEFYPYPSMVAIRFPAFLVRLHSGSRCIKLSASRQFPDPSTARIFSDASALRRILVPLRMLQRSE